MYTITINVTDLGYEDLREAAKSRGVSIAQIAEERLTEAEEYKPDPTVDHDVPYTEDEIVEEEHNNADRRALREWHQSLAKAIRLRFGKSHNLRK